MLISSAVALIVLEWSNGNQCGGIIRTVRGECGAAVFLSQVFSKENILIQPDKTRICLIPLQAFPLNYSRPALVCLLSLCEKEADGASSRAYCSELWMDALWPHPVTKQHIHKCEECLRKQLAVVVLFFLLYFPAFVWFFFYIWKYVSGSELKCDARPDGWTLRVKKQTELANCNVEVCQSQWKLHSDQSDLSMQKFEENRKTLEIELGDLKLENFVDKKIWNIPLTSYILNKAKQSYFSTVICPLKISTEGSVSVSKVRYGRDEHFLFLSQKQLLKF